MAHNIAFNKTTGKHMSMTAGALPWHNLGQNTSDAKTWQETIELAQLNWKVADAPLYTQWSKSGNLRVKGYKAIVRLDTHETLGVHGESYQMFQNERAFTFADDFLEGGARFESAGGLGNGSVIWALARIPQADFTIGNGDKHEMYLLVATSHDGSLAFTATPTDVRVVCNNTLNMALGARNKSADGKLKVKHTSRGEARLNEAQRLIAGTIQSAETLKVKLNQLAHVKLTKQSLTDILDRLFKPTDGANQTRRTNMLSEILASYEVNDHNAFPDQRGTAYNLLNAITDYTDHLRGTKRADQDKTVDYARSESAMFGSGAKLKSEALDVIYQTVMDGSALDGQASNGASLLDTILSN